MYDIASLFTYVTELTPKDASSQVSAYTSADLGQSSYTE